MKTVLRIAAGGAGALFILYSAALNLTLSFNLGNILPGIAGIFVVLYSLFYNGITKFWSKGTGKALSILFAAGLIFFLSSFALMCVAIGVRASQAPGAGADAVVVLGAGLAGDKVSAALASRLDKAIEYLNANENCVAVVSGGKGPGERISEADAMERYLLERGVAPGRIHKEDKSSSTKENFKFSKTILDGLFGENDYTVVYATNDFHVIRAGFYAGREGLKAQALPCPSQFYMLPSYYSREYLALAYYFAFEVILK